jgi:hypothetical protein
MGACLEDVQLRRAHLESTLFIGSSIDGKTLIAACFLDDKTNFTMTGLDSARIEPAMLTRLKTNIRRFEWKKWYRMRKSERYQMRKTESKASLFTPLLNKLLPSNTDCDHPFIILFMLPVLLFFFLLLAIPIWIIRDFDVTVLFIRLFWWISDYGSSTKRILKTFMIMVCAFTALYAGLEYCGFNVLEQTAFPMGTSLGSQFNWLATLFFFSFATMVTLGFGNINVVLNAPSSVLGMLLVAANLFTGYFLLAVLVTRIGILFQSLGPEAEVTKSKRKEASSKS